jgi:hypothetical protein
MKKITNIIEKTYILTKDGYFYIDDLLGTNIIWDGYKWREVIIFQNDNILQEKTYYKLIFSDGCEVICDSTHKLYIVDDMSSNIYRTIPITSIKENSLLYKYSFPFIEGDNKNNLKYPYISGYNIGYMYNINNINNEYISKEHIDNIYIKIPNIIYNIDSSNLSTYIPINASLNNRLLWLSGLIDVNGSITNIKDGIYLNIIVNSKEFAMKVKYLCNTLGTNPRILENTEIRKVILNKSPNLYKNIQENSNKNYKKRYTLIFNAEDTNKIFLEYDIKTYYFIYDKSQYSLDQDINRYLSIKKIVKFIDIKKSYSITDTYSLIGNGILI